MDEYSLSYVGSVLNEIETTSRQWVLKIKTNMLIQLNMFNTDMIPKILYKINFILEFRNVPDILNIVSDTVTKAMIGIRGTHVVQLIFQCG